ncbi:MAG: tetratricopeptide repeat protein, partial [Gemmatimonadetes bacterium]|nr:tetratricopeptide repeat protein [Gemmatimonadota bacterium]
RVIIEPWLRENPDDARAYGALGIALAGLGRYAEAVREGRKAVELVPLSKDAFNAKEHLRELARIYAMVGEHDAAIDELELLLSLPGPLSVARLRIDPTWDPLREHPRFQALVARGHE